MANEEPAEATASPTAQVPTTARGRNYPALKLSEAIAHADTLYQRAKRSFVPLPIACGYWGYKATSSSGMRCVATMIAYGLVDDTGSKDARQLKLSDVAYELTRNPNKSTPEYRKALRTAALSPAIMREIEEHYRSVGDLPPDDQALAWDLDRKFRMAPAACDLFIPVLRETFSLAGVFGPATMESGSEETPQQPTGGPPGTAAGNNPAGSPTMIPSTAQPPPGTSAIHVVATPTTRELPLPLLSGGTAILRLPYAISDEDYDWMTLMLQKLKRTITMPPPFVPGDLVQWQSQGVDQFSAPTRITRVQEGFAFVEGSETGIPIAQLRKV
jgi:hypothetical protein